MPQTDLPGGNAASPQRTRDLRVAWFGARHFAHSLEGPGIALQVFPQHQPAVFDWKHILERTGRAPDLLVLGDASLPPVFVGVEDFPCLTAIHCVDTHIHGWMEHYAQAFDLCTVSLKDHLGRFEGGALAANQLAWLPAFSRETDKPAATAQSPLYDVLFVGAMQPDRNPGRIAFLGELKTRLAGLAIRTGDYTQLYPLARIVLNEAERGDLNFRVFEALGCGSCLVTPDIGHGLRELFTPGKELALYPPGDAAACARVCEDLLRSPEKRAAMARAGLARVDRDHRARRRASAFLDLVSGLDPDQPGRRREKAAELRRKYLKRLYLHFAEVCDDKRVAQIYLNASRGEC
ncbi:MAG: glycosyltransferase family 1 protein [Desulfovibrionaceae bacterium]|nr:glycosyltransferase family 1 protein [Desulfovibrionaceae bacterium]MBF0513906.1 glycosyltransferase family 1 protein [Desulfovibrionaceae bacterium]